MKNLILCLLAVTSLFVSVAHADETQGWTPVLSTLVMTQSPDYRDLLIQNSGTYSEIRMQVLNDAWIDRVDVISHIIWGTAINGLDGRYTQGDIREATFPASNVRFLRIYARSAHPGMAVRVKVWMR